MIIVMGSARSGTTWLAKLFDSHPDTLYRHEPDSIAPTRDIPFLPEPEEIAAHREQARAYIAALAAERRLKAAGRLPVYPKSYRGEGARRALHGVIYALKGTETLARRAGLSPEFRVPDFRERGRRPRLVIKSVSSLGRMRLFAEAAPEAHFVHIIRHPCGVVASQLRGRSSRVLMSQPFVRVMHAIDREDRLGLSLADLEALPLEQQLAYHWMVLNEKVSAEMAGHPLYHRVVYEDLCHDPLGGMRMLLGAVGLPWHAQVAETIAALNRSAAPARGGDYFGISREAERAAWGWRDELRPEQAAGVLRVLEASPLRDLYTDPRGRAAAPAPHQAQPA